MTTSIRVCNRCDTCGRENVREGIMFLVFSPEVEPTPVLLCRPCVARPLLDQVIGASERAEAFYEAASARRARA